MRSIKFQNRPAPDPVAASSTVRYRDLCFKEPYRNMTMRFDRPQTWIRFLPSIEGSTQSWLTRLETIRDINKTTFLHPKTKALNMSNVICPFDIAEQWFRNNDPGCLYSRDKNPNGFKLYTRPYGVAWVVDIAGKENERLRIFNASLHDGVKGGQPGLGFKVYDQATLMDMEPDSKTYGERIYEDITHPQKGRLIGVKKRSEASQYASYEVTVARQPNDIDSVIDQLSEAEVEKVTALEDTLNVLTEGEMMEILQGYIGDKFFTEIFPGESTSRQSISKPKVEEVEEDDAAEPEPEPEPVKKAVTKPVVVEEEEEEPVIEPKKAPKPKAEVKAEVKPAATKPAGKGVSNKEVVGRLDDQNDPKNRQYFLDHWEELTAPQQTMVREHYTELSQDGKGEPLEVDAE